MAANDNLTEGVRSTIDYLATGGLSEVIGLTSVAMHQNYPKVQSDTDMAMALCLLAAEALEARARRRVRSLKRGTTYRVLGEAEVRISKPTLSIKGRLLTEGEKLTVYQADEDGKLWVRFPDEFEDGRFEEIA